MSSNLKECPHCDKRMPAHILVKHLAKSHPEPEVAPDATGATLKTEEVEKVTSIKIEPNIDPVEVKKVVVEKEWDWGEIQECGVCKEEYPQKIMPFHIRQEHGI